MKKAYDKSIHLHCIVCGSTDDFEFNEDKSFIKCLKCNKEYPGGYEELVELNQSLIQEEVEATKTEIIKDVEKDIRDMFKDDFRGNKYVKFK